ncbi:ribosomal protein S18 acetylase RimI-like enzyme [Loktanella ponticola]|uniref:Ribosomal protein S18 acetylase RimI-like enzyme n=1 Tax=Yoonia ponticola TaxID=1524255 RepID=A0A7W9BM96_9RHOB|nr:GNAT family N-acetyltransferase [Yoonia ponticola]MBB5722957.1 ribosomal protein S18 acetylase RimI-like enzyme [Yoonia ponticola]
MRIQMGIPRGAKAQAAALYWGAFGEKLGTVMGPEPKAMAYILRVIDSRHAISAVDDDGTLLGVVGFKTNKGALVGGTYSDFAAIYGHLGAIWRAVLLSLLERDTENRRFLMDGIFVAPAARGKGVGSALLVAIMNEGHQRGYPSLRLDVIDTNPRAKALYERHGFAPTDTTKLGPLRHIFKFHSVTTMVKKL